MGYHALMRFVAGLGLVIVLGAAATAHAEGGPVAAAKEHFDKGQSLYLRGMYDEAALEFIAAYEAKPFAAFLFNTAVCYEKARLYERALDFFRRYLAGSPTADDRAAVTMRMVELEKLVAPGPAAPATAPASQSPSGPASRTAAAPPPAPPPTALPPLDTKGLVVVESKPAGALVYLDDKMKGPLGTTPWSGSLPRGDYKILVEAKGYKPETRTIRPAGDRLLVLYMALSEEHYLGWIEIEGNVPGVDVYVDKREAGPVGRTPFSGFLVPGKHVLFLEREGYVPQRREVVIARGKPHRVDFHLDLVPHGWLEVGVNKEARGARVLVDGEEACRAPCRVKLAPGSHKVVVEQSGFKKYKGVIAIDRAVETRVSTTMYKAPSRVSAYVSFIFSAGMLGTGTYFGLRSRAEQNELKQDLANGRLIASDDPRIKAGWTHAVAADALFALGGITGLLGLYYALRNPGPNTRVELQTKNFAVTPVVGPATVGLRGRF
jgi:tetratricopeptide (TPR) repeat protein